MTRWWIVAVSLALAVTASAQDRDTGEDHDRSAPRRPTELPREHGSTYDPSDEAPPPDAPGRAAPPGTAPPSGPASEDKESEIQWKSTGRARLEIGYDTNVLRAQRGAVHEGFFHGYGLADLLVSFPEERELYASVSGEGFRYFHHTKANESYASFFLDYYHPMNQVFDLEVQNDFAYSAQNLLDDNGDFLFGGVYDSYDEGVRATLIAHATQRLSFEVMGGGRFDIFEPNPGIPYTYSYWEARGGIGLRYKPWADGRFRIRYLFREREYFELPPNLRFNGAPTSTNDKLEVQRHQGIVTFSQKAEFEGLRVVAQLGYTYTYNDDTFQEDRTYRENAFSAHLELSPIPDWTEIDFDLRVAHRDYLVRQTLVRGAPFYGTRLELTYCEITVALSQKLFDVAMVRVALVGEAAYTFYHSTDVSSSYDRVVLQLGIEGSF